MPYFRQSGAEFAPYIIAKVRFNLGITNIRLTNNIKHCSNDYWNEAVITVAKDYGIIATIFNKILRL